MIASAGLLQLLRRLLRALSLNLSDSRKAIRSLYYYFGLGWSVEHAARSVFVASGRRSGTTSGRSRSAEEKSDVTERNQIPVSRVRL